MVTTEDTLKQKTAGQFLVTQNKLIFDAMTKQSKNDSVDVSNLLGAFLILESDSTKTKASATLSSK